MRFTETPEHIFECTYPVPKDEIIWVNHPELPIKACQYGMVVPFVDDRNVEISHGTNISSWGIPENVAINHTCPKVNQRKRLTVTSGGMGKWVYECFSGQVVAKNHQVKTKNFNPWDNRPENLFLPSEQSSSEIYRRQIDREQFITNSIVEMVKREKYFTPDSDMVEYFNVIGVPYAISRYYVELKEQGYIKFLTQSKLKYAEIKNNILHI